MSKVIYAGPTIPGVATKNTVYSEIPDSLERAAKVAPYIKSLCVPLSEMATVTQQLRKREGAYYTFYTMALRDSAALKGESTNAL